MKETGLPSPAEKPTQGSLQRNRWMNQPSSEPPLYSERQLHVGIQKIPLWNMRRVTRREEQPRFATPSVGIFTGALRIAHRLIGGPSRFNRGGVNDGLTPPIVLALWALYPGGTHHLTAAADPKTPKWALTRLITRVVRPRNQKGPVDVYLRLMETLLANPELTPAHLNTLINIFQQHIVPEPQYREERVSSLILSHPNLNPATQKQLAALPHAASRCLGATPVDEILSTRRPPTKRVERLSRLEMGASEICAAAHHLSLTEEEVEHLCHRWIAGQKSFVAENKTPQSGPPEMEWRAEEHTRNAEEYFGHAAALLLTHPSATEDMRESVLAVLHRSNLTCTWVITVKKLFLTSPSVPGLIERAVLAGDGVEKNDTQSPDRDLMGFEESKRWMILLDGLEERAPHSEDQYVIRSGLLRHPSVAAHLVTRPSLTQRIVWTPDLVRHCLLSSVKNVREFGLSGVQASAQERQSRTTAMEGPSQDETPSGAQYPPKPKR